MPVILRWLLRLGPTNPIAVRLVQNGSRRSKHLYLRLAYLGVLIAVLLWALVINTKGDQMSFKELAAAGASSFQEIAYLQIGLICILAPVFMAGAIAQEADPRTWDILLTTPLGATEIVLGNLLGRLFFILALLLASLPLFAVTQYFGGVRSETIMASYLIAGCAATLVGCAAVALSVSRVVGRRAVFTFYVAVVSYIAVTWAADSLAGGGKSVTWFTAINPFLAQRALLNPTGYVAAGEGTQVGLAKWFLERPAAGWCMISLLCSFLLIVASVITVRVGGIAGLGGFGGKGSADGKVPWYRKMLGFGAAGSVTRAAKHVWHNPISWREAASRNATFGRTMARWSFVAIGVAWGLVMVLMLSAKSVTPTTFRTLVMFTVMGEMAVITLVAINMSATAVSREREDGTLDLLLTTPITPAQYLTGKLRGMLFYLLPMLSVPVLTLFIAGGYAFLGEIGALGATNPASVSMTVAASIGSGAASTLTVPLVLPEAGIVSALVSVPFVALCVMVGMYVSLRSKGTIGSVMSTVGIIAVVAGVVGWCSWNSGASVPFLGPVMAAFSPAAVDASCIFPEDALTTTISKHGLASARTGLFMGALVSAALHIAVVYGLRSTMTRNFDMTVRRLAGMK